jgi:hypothetical protein
MFRAISHLRIKRSFVPAKALNKYSTKSDALPPLVSDVRKTRQGRVLVSPSIRSENAFTKGTVEEWDLFTAGLWTQNVKSYTSWQRFLDIINTKNALKLKPVHFQMLV